MTSISTTSPLRVSELGFKHAKRNFLISSWQGRGRPLPCCHVLIHDIQMHSTRWLAHTVIAARQYRALLRTVKRKVPCLSNTKTPQVNYGPIINFFNYNVKIKLYIKATIQ